MGVTKGNVVTATLFQSWAAGQTPPKPLPSVIATLENPYLQALKLAEHTEATFYQRQERRVRTWYHEHPKCNQMLLPLDWRDNQLRGESLIDADSRFGRGWFERVSDVERPEHRLEEIETYNDALTLANVLISPEWRREVLAEYPLPKVQPRKPKAQALEKQLALNLSFDALTYN